MTKNMKAYEQSWIVFNVIIWDMSYWTPGGVVWPGGWNQDSCTSYVLLTIGGRIQKLWRFPQQLLYNMIYYILQVFTICYTIY